MVSRWLLISCVLVACEVPDKMPSQPTTMPGEVPGATFDARSTTDDAQSASADAATPDAAPPQIPCDDDDDDADGKDCEKPPDRCIDDDFLLRYKDGKCVAGVCVFSHEVKYCEDGCEDDECD